MSNIRPRVLVLVPRFPYPVIGGDRLRIYYLCRELAKDYSLTLLSLCETQEEMNMKVPSDGIFERIERVYLPKWKSAFNVLCALPSSSPLQVAYYRSKEFGRRIDELLPSHDLSLAHLIRTGDYLLSKKCIRVLEMTDAISLNYKRVKELKAKKTLKTLVYSIESERLFRYEKRVVHDFDLVSLVSDTDRSFLIGEAGRGERVLTCSNGVDFSGFPYSERKSGSQLIVFIGNMLSAQNLDACDFFIKEIFPGLRSKFGALFRVVGRISDADAARFRSFEGVEVTGLVDSIPAAVSDAAVAVCPMRIGAGVQNKVLEYMALGIPAITSSIGFEGLAAVDGKDLIVANSYEEYERAVERLFSDDVFSKGMARSARAYVERDHDWVSMMMPLRNRVKEVLSGRA